MIRYKIYFGDRTDIIYKEAKIYRNKKWNKISVKDLNKNVTVGDILELTDNYDKKYICEVVIDWKTGASWDSFFFCGEGTVYKLKETNIYQL